MQIHESIIHGVQKAKDASGPTSTNVKPRETALNSNDANTGNLVVKLAEDVLKLYGKLSNGYGILGSDPDLHTFPTLLNRYVASQTDMVAFTKLATALIASAMAQHRFTTTSYPIFINYQNQGRHWLLIAMLKLKEGIGIDEETLDLNGSLSFDVSNLREAARIDISKWQNNEQPYLSFIKRGTGDDSESSAYFRNALSCIDYTDAKKNTELALKAVDDYCEREQWDPGQRQTARLKAYEYCREKKEAGEPVNLIALSARINDQSPDAFVSFIRENEYEVNETFSPDPNVYKRLQRITKKFRGVSIGFDINEIATDRVYYDPDIDGLVLRNPPQDLVAEINKAKGVSSTEE